MSIYDTLNDCQKQGVATTEGPVLILAGAGSGKTRVLTARVAYLIEEKNISPYNIMAITFTNKAAGEMKERVNQMVRFGAEAVWVATFHATCVRMLKRYADRLGYTSDFTIYDADDQKTLMKEVLKKLRIDNKVYKERSFLAAISSAKNELIDPAAYRDQIGDDYAEARIADVYDEYQKSLRQSNAMDFDDLLMQTVFLFRGHEEILTQYQERFRYIMVDEYQDTNSAQFAFVSLLAGKYRNICVVGDDDQSIYKFRGANIHNILDFEKVYPDATVIRLEQNYRSTQNILDAANAVIANNEQRKQKSLWTARDGGSRVHCKQFDTAYEEAEFIADDIASKVKEKKAGYGDCAVLYRTNAQARLIEEKLVIRAIPYDIVGGTNFYVRREIKDLLAYLKTIENARDDLAARRIINVPKRGVGLTSIQRVSDYAAMQGLSFFDALREANMVEGLGKAAGRIGAFTEMIKGYRRRLKEDKAYSVADMLDDIIIDTGYVEDLRANDDDADDRIENIDELLNKAVSFAEENPEGTLADFLDEVALVADIDKVEGGSDLVLLMTIHSAKGLEFPHVYITGLEEGVFPSYMSIDAKDADAQIEEERRLAYVAITRASEDLTLTSAKQRMLHGETRYNMVSRFLKEIPESLLDSRVGSSRKMVVQSASKVYAPASQKPYVAVRGSVQGAGAIGQGLPAMGTKPDYAENDRVTHIKYGIGTVKKLEKGPKDYQVTVDFDSAGTKVMYAAFAKLVKAQ